MEQKTERVLHRYGDVELWKAEAEDRSWSLPLLIQWCEDKAQDTHYAHIRPAVCLYQSQSLALQSLLKAHDIQGRPDQWVITRRMAEALLHKAPGITPSFYYRWPTDDGPPIEPAKAIHTPMGEQGFVKPRSSSFVEWLSKERKIPSSIINAVLRGIADEAPVWMVKHRQPLDLGFCRIIAAPFRANWKEIVAFKCKHLKLRSLLRLPEDQIWKALEDMGFPSILTSPHNVALRRGWKQTEADVGRIDYTLECIPSDTFESAANRIEGQRIARGPTAYLTEFEDAVADLYKSLVLAMRSYLAKVRKPHAEVRVSGLRRLLGFSPVLGRKIEISGTPITHLPIHLVANDSAFSVFGKSDDSHLVRPPPIEMPKLPDLLSETGDVRECPVNGDMELTNGEGTDRLPLCNGSQKQIEGEHMLAGGSDTGDGLDDSGAINI